MKTLRIFLRQKFKFLSVIRSIIENMVFINDYNQSLVFNAGKCHSKLTLERIFMDCLVIYCLIDFVLRFRECRVSFENSMKTKSLNTSTVITFVTSIIQFSN